MPWVDVGPDGAVNVIFYDSRNDVNNLLTEVYVARSTDGGSTFTNYKVSDQQFTPIAIPGYASGYMGDYIGIASGMNKAYPIWMDNRSSSKYQLYTQTITFGVVVDQKLSTGSAVGTIGRWNGNSFPTPRLNPGATIPNLLGTTEVLQGDQSIYSSQKFNIWVRNNGNERYGFDHIGSR
ncbi:MAG: hypothetical protein NTX22_05770 [Ignavibacteriales bacterium]|nr:hypothetical protein [Ignavibacteriales bacterium]